MPSSDSSAYFFLRQSGRRRRRRARQDLMKLGGCDKGVASAAKKDTVHNRIMIPRRRDFHQHFQLPKELQRRKSRTVSPSTSINPQLPKEVQRQKSGTERASKLLNQVCVSFARAKISSFEKRRRASSQTASPSNFGSHVLGLGVGLAKQSSSIKPQYSSTFIDISA